jgi:hypothetical protein
MKQIKKQTIMKDYIHPILKTPREKKNYYGIFNDQHIYREITHEMLLTFKNLISIHETKPNRLPKAIASLSPTLKLLFETAPEEAIIPGHPTLTKLAGIAIANTFHDLEISQQVLPPLYTFVSINKTTGKWEFADRELHKYIHRDKLIHEQINQLEEIVKLDQTPMRKAWDIINNHQQNPDPFKTGNNAQQHDAGMQRHDNIIDKEKTVRDFLFSDPQNIDRILLALKYLNDPSNSNKNIEHLPHDLQPFFETTSVHSYSKPYNSFDLDNIQKPTLAPAAFLIINSESEFYNSKPCNPDPKTTSVTVQNFAKSLAATIKFMRTTFKTDPNDGIPYLYKTDKEFIQEHQLLNQVNKRQKELSDLKEHMTRL